MNPFVAVVGGGPAGLAAAEAAVGLGAEVDVFDSMPSVGRKFLVAGRGGLNITNSEPREAFLARYRGGGERWMRLLADFGPERLRTWVESHGITTFVGSGRRVYPSGMKSAPLLRRWVAGLRASGVQFHGRHSLRELTRESDAWRLSFAAPGGERTFRATSVVLAMGGASWPSTGSDGAWVNLLTSHGVRVESLIPSNCGWEVAWPQEVFSSLAGSPLKNIATLSEGTACRGELMITNYGLEGGALYAVTPQIRSSGSLSLDLKPAWSREELLRRMATAKRLHLHEAFERWRLDGIARRLLEAVLPPDARASLEALAGCVKNLPVPLKGSRPIAEAISSAGGVDWSELDEDLMLHRLPGVYAAGEMIDWEAPTGGYLMQGCFATGFRAGCSAALFNS